jgi:hypothetical protein
MTSFLCPMLRALFAIVLLAPAATTALAQEQSMAEQRMVGTWYGEFAPSASSPAQRFITVRRADGTFTLQARMYQDGKKVAEARNSGMWGISNGMYFTVTTEVNGKPSDAKRPEAINAYLVKVLDANRFEYMHVASGSQFTVTRADPANVRLPD